jgi:hypothetical protein
MKVQNSLNSTDSSLYPSHLLEASAPLDPALETQETFAESARNDALKGLEVKERLGTSQTEDKFTPVKPERVSAEVFIPRLRQIARDFFPPTSGQATTTVNSFGGFGSLLNVRQGGFMNTNNFNVSIGSGNSDRQRDNGMPCWCRVLVFVVGAVSVYFANSSLGKLDRHGKEANADLEKDYPADHEITRKLDLIDHKIIDITNKKQELAILGCTAAIVAIAAAAFASYALMWVALFGGVYVMAKASRASSAGELDVSAAIRENYDLALGLARSELSSQADQVKIWNNWPN